MASSYGTGEHVVYVSVGGGSKRFGQSNMGKICVTALGMTLAACLVYSSAREGRRFVSNPASGLAQRNVMSSGLPSKAVLNQLAAQLAAKEMHVELLHAGSKGLPSKIKSMLSSLVNAPKTLLADCSNPAAYTTLKTTFSSLLVNLTAHNATIYAEDAKLLEAYTTSEAAYLASDSTFRTAQFSAKSAKSAATYAKGEYDKYASAKDAGQTTYAQNIAPMNEEKAELTKSIPIIEMIQKMVEDMLNEMAASDGAAAKSGVQSLTVANLPVAKLSKLKALAYKALAPKKDLWQLVLLRSMLEEGSHIDKHMIMKLPRKIIVSMQKRLVEIETDRQKMLADLATDDALYTEWQTKLVMLSDEEDSAVNKAQTADLSREKLAGVHEVKESAYMGYHGAFVEEATQISSQVAALKTISIKIDAAIEQCAAAA